MINGMNETAFSITNADKVSQTKALLRAVSVKILSSAAQECSNKLYNKSRTNRSNGVRGLQSTDV